MPFVALMAFTPTSIIVSLIYKLYLSCVFFIFNFDNTYSVMKVYEDPVSIIKKTLIGSFPFFLLNLQYAINLYPYFLIGIAVFPPPILRIAYVSNGPKYYICPNKSEI